MPTRSKKNECILSKMAEIDMDCISAVMSISPDVQLYHIHGTNQDGTPKRYKLDNSRGDFQQAILKNGERYIVIKRYFDNVKEIADSFRGKELT